MKGIFQIFFILILFCISAPLCSALEIYHISRAEQPRWEDICPTGYEDAEYKEIKWFWPYGAQEVQAQYNYWANRREQFEGYVNDCEGLLGEFRVQCYEELKQKQRYDNEQYRLNSIQKKVTESTWKDFNYRGVKPIMIELNPNKKRRIN